MTEPLLRPAAATDMPAVTDIYRDAVLHGTASFEIEPPTEEEMLRRFRAIVDGGYPYLVAEIGGAVAGYAYVGPYRTRPAYRFTVENSVYIAPAAQGKGVGRALLLALIQACTVQRYRLMIAVIGDSGHHASIGLHRQLGFRFCGTLHAVGYKFSRWLDSVIMELPLGEGGSTLPLEEPVRLARR
jgi:phosphinothricin acetyltransferase